MGNTGKSVSMILVDLGATKVKRFSFAPFTLSGRGMRHQEENVRGSDASLGYLKVVG